MIKQISYIAFGVRGYRHCKKLSRIFFKSPGALSREYNPEGSNPSKLCGICSNQKTCPRNASERYYGYHGAYRCLTEGAGDVAFVSHLSVFDFTGLENDLNPGEDFGLLCPDGSRKGKVKVNYLRDNMAGVVPTFVWPAVCFDLALVFVKTGKN